VASTAKPFIYSIRPLFSTFSAFRASNNYSLLALDCSQEGGGIMNVKSLVGSCVASGLLLCLLALAAPAQSTAPTLERDARFNKALKRFDGDHDGRLSQQELSSKPKMFSKLDTNHDGFVTREEFDSAARHDHHKRLTQALEAMDKNHDGQITRDEWTGSAESFDRLDLNHNGAITREEMQVRSPKHKKSNETSP
jgi:Ca2+-binding EF-hand superfamily protein